MLNYFDHDYSVQYFICYTHSLPCLSQQCPYCHTDFKIHTQKPVDGCPPICTPEYVFCTLYIAIAASHFNAVFRLLDFGQGSF